jgi:hypothetical protein
VRAVPWDVFVAGNASKVLEAWRQWASDWPWWFQAFWLAGIGVAVVLHRRVASTRVPLAAGIVLGCVPLLLLQRVVPPARIWVFLFPIFAGMGAAGALAMLGPAIARQGIREGRGRWVVVGLALLVLVAGALSVPGRSRQYRYNLAEFPGAEQAVMFLVRQVQPGDQVLVLGMSQTPFLYYARRHGLPDVLVYDYPLKGWGPLRDAARVFIVMLDPRRTLDDVVTEAQLRDAGAPVPIAQFFGGEIYAVRRERGSPPVSLPDSPRQADRLSHP